VDCHIGAVDNSQTEAEFDYIVSKIVLQSLRNRVTLFRWYV
jgi:hypothetical protein